MRLRRFVEIIGIAAIFALLIAAGMYWYEYRLQKEDDRVRMNFLARQLAQKSRESVNAAAQTGAESVSEAAAVTSSAAPSTNEAPKASVDSAPALPSGIDAGMEAGSTVPISTPAPAADTASDSSDSPRTPMNAAPGDAPASAAQ